jgi:hypothetical protein
MDHLRIWALEGNYETFVYLVEKKEKKDLDLLGECYDITQDEDIKWYLQSVFDEEEYFEL